MRLDSHIHIADAHTLRQIAEIAPRVGMTHYAGIMKDDVLHLFDRLDETAKGIPFHWLNPTVDTPFRDVPVAGYKLHPRQVKLPDGALFMSTPENLGAICVRAGREHRPLLFHTDGDEPNPASVPMLAELARAFPDTNIIAGHLGVYTQECFITQYTPETWEPMVEPLFRQHFRLLIEVPNLYADTTKFGMDFPWRSADPMHRLKVFSRIVQSLPRTEQRALVDKLFVGTDFPNFADPTWEQNASLQGTDHVVNSHLGFQYCCMHRAFGDLFDEDRLVENFYRLLPGEFRP